MMKFNVLDCIAHILVIIGAINWGLVGFFKYDLVSALCGGPTAMFSRIIFGLVGLAGLYVITFLFRHDNK